jgi:ABC-2 type transport system permease protein
MLVVVTIPASRIRGLFVFLGIAIFLILFIAFRLLRPERLVDPEAFASVLIYLKALRTPSSPLLPSTWAFNSIQTALTGNFQASIFHNGLAWSCVAVLIFINIILADVVYFKGLSKAQTAATRLIKYRPGNGSWLAFLPGPIRALTAKEIKSFFRDQTQWSQLFLIGALVVIYIYNFKVLPLEKSPIKTVYLQNLLAFLNMGLACFVLTAISARFAYPAVSNEGQAFWLVKSAPVRIKTFLWIKFFIYFFPLLVLTEIIIVATNIFLQVTPFMMTLSTVSVLFMVPGVVAMGIGLGAAYADFNSENPTQTVTSFGGFLFMVLCGGFIAVVIILEASPVYRLFMADLRNRGLGTWEWIWILGSFLTVLLLCILTIILPMKFGEKKLSRRLI